MKTATRIALLVIVFAFGLRMSSAQTPLASEFTYQGHLEENGSPAGGAHGFDFSLYDAEFGGNQIGSTINVVTVVVDGNFTAELDFGADSLNGDNRWLEIVVNGTTLSPRQPITATPYSVQTRGIFVSDDKSFVGVGRNNSVTNSEHFGVHAPAPDGTFGGMYMSTDGESALPFYGYAAGGTADAWHYYDGATGDWKLNNSGTRMTIGNNGSASIGSAFVAPGDGSLELGNSALSIASDGFVGVGRNTPITAAEAFGVYTDSTGFGGMYIETALTGQPFYGYSAGGGVDAFHYFEGSTGNWHLNNGGDQRITVAADGYVGFGRNAPAANWPTSRFGIASDDPQRVGMVVQTTSLSAIPYYGYNDADFSGCFTYYDNTGGTSGRWAINFPGAGDAITVESSGHVGIITDFPSYNLEVDGNAGKPGGGSWSNSSDRRLKKKIVGLDGSLERLMSLRGVTFEYIDPDSINELDGQRIGMIAQEVEQVFPDWVHEREDGYKAVTFRGFEALTVEALRELREEKDQQITSLEQENEELRERVANLEAIVLELKAHMSTNQN